MTTAKKMLDVAAKYIGVSGTDNIFNTWYWGYHCYNPDVYPWCAVFQSYVAMEAKLKCNYSASAAGFANQFERIPVSKEDTVRKGDIVVFNWDGRNDISWCDHVGIVEWSTIGTDGKFGTIEGNTGNASGGEVKRVTRTNWGAYFTAFFRPKYDAESEDKSTSSNTTNSTTSSKKTLNGIDIASHQDDHGIDVTKVSADFVIVKVSGGSAAHPYLNPKWKQNAEKVLKSGKLLGLYHYAGEYGEKRTGADEAAYFLKQIKGFEGKAILCLDWEEKAESFGIGYAKAWLDAVAKATGATPLFYARAGFINEVDCSSIKKYPLWMASYLYRYEYGKGYVDDPANTWDTGAWDKMTIYQYSSTRYISGYSERLDVNKFYGTAEDWKRLCGSGKGSSSTKPASSDTSSKTDKTTATAFRLSTDSTGKKWLAAGKQPARGKAIRWIAAKGFGKFRVFTERYGWLPYINAYDVNDLEKGCAGDGSPIIAVEFKSSNARYAVRIINGNWYPDMIGRKDTAGSTDHFAGDLANRIDGFRISKA